MSRDTRDVVILVATGVVAGFIMISSIVLSIAMLMGLNVEQPFRALIAIVGALAGAISGYVIGKGVPPIETTDIVK